MGRIEVGAKWWATVGLMASLAGCATAEMSGEEAVNASTQTLTSLQFASYNPSAAVAYSNANCSFGPELCAGFVSEAAIEAGGLPFSFTRWVPDLYKELTANNVPYDEYPNAGPITACPGDIVIFSDVTGPEFCTKSAPATNCGHTGLVVGAGTTPSEILGDFHNVYHCGTPLTTIFRSGYKAFRIYHLVSCGLTQDEAPRPKQEPLMVWRPSNKHWYVAEGGAEERGPKASVEFGLAGDVPVAADYDGDGRPDIAMWRPDSGIWFAMLSGGGSIEQEFGKKGDIPAPADYTGDGSADFAIFRPSEGRYYVWDPRTRFSAEPVWGAEGDIPVPGDYDGDGKAEIALYRPSNRVWYMLLSSRNYAPHVREWGQPGDIAVPGDYDGDGMTDRAVFTPSTGTWTILKSSTVTALVERWGQLGDIPVPRDYDGDGRTDMATWRPSTQVFFFWNSLGQRERAWGAEGDVPVFGRR